MRNLVCHIRRGTWDENIRKWDDEVVWVYEGGRNRKVDIKLHKEDLRDLYSLPPHGSTAPSGPGPPH
jgi:hypothetical protein